MAAKMPISQALRLKTMIDFWNLEVPECSSFVLVGYVIQRADMVLDTPRTQDLASLVLRLNMTWLAIGVRTTYCLFRCSFFSSASIHLYDAHSPTPHKPISGGRPSGHQLVSTLPSYACSFPHSSTALKSRH